MPAKPAPLPPVRIFCEKAPVDGDRGALVGMCHFACEYDWREPATWKRWLPRAVENCMVQLRAKPEGSRCVRANWLLEYQTASKEWGTWSPNVDWRELDLGGIPTGIPKAQMKALGKALKAERLTLDIAYLDNENATDAHQTVMVAEALGRCCVAGDPLAVRKKLFGALNRPVVVNFNQIMPAPVGPACLNWWGKYAPACPDGRSSCFEVYFTRSTYRQTLKIEGPHHWLWDCFTDAINTLRSCATVGPTLPIFSGARQWDEVKAIGHRPELRPAVQFLTEEFIAHAACTGQRRMLAANYMANDPEANEESLSAAAMKAGKLGEATYMPEGGWPPVSTGDAVVRTGAAVTFLEEFLSVLGTAGRMI